MACHEDHMPRAKTIFFFAGHHDAGHYKAQITHHTSEQGDVARARASRPRLVHGAVAVLGLLLRLDAKELAGVLASVALVHAVLLGYLLALLRALLREYRSNQSSAHS